MLASISQGHVDLADFLFLVAFILCVVVFIIRIMAKAWDMAIMAAAVGCIALAYFVL